MILSYKDMPSSEPGVCLGELLFKQRLGSNFQETVAGMIDILATARYNKMIEKLRKIYADVWSSY